LLFGWKVAVFVAGDGHGGGGCIEGVPDGLFVGGGAEQQADGWVVVFFADRVVDDGDVEIRALTRLASGWPWGAVSYRGTDWGDPPAGRGARRSELERSRHP